MMSSQNKTPSTSTTTSSSSSSSSRLRASSTKSMMVMMKESPKRSTSAPTPTPKPKPVATTLNDNISTKPRRPKSEELVPGPHPNLEQFPRPRRLKKTEDDSDANNKKKNKYNNNNNNNNNNSKQVLLHEIKVENGIDKDLMIKDLEDQVVKLKSELDKALAFNSDLQLQNHKLSQELAAAHSKIATLSPQREYVGEHQSPKFKDIQKLIANKLERSVVKKDTISKGNTNVKTPSSSPPSQPPPPPPPTPPISPSPKVTAVEKKAPMPSSMPLPPPLPPPPPPPPSARAPPNRKAPAFLEFYQSLTKQEGERDSPPGPANHHKQVAISAHSGIVGEIQNRSAHLLAIKADIETKGEFINGLITKVQTAAYSNIEDVLKFVDWLDGELATLADERAVLKNFKWPERKADALREAAVEYRELKLLESEISSYKDIDTDIPYAAALKKMASLLDKSERSIQKLIKLRSSVLHSYQELKIPADWMLDSGIVSTIKQASMNLVKMFMKRVRLEMESIHNSDRESLLLQGVNFAYRAHQFAGGLDSETLCAFEEIRQRFPGHLRGSREELLPAIPSS